MTTGATMRTLDETRGAVRVDDLYDTDIEDLWQACTTPERLTRWIATVDGDLRVGGTVHAVFTSSWPLRHLPFHASGWRAHLEDLGRSLEVDGPVHPEGWSPEAGAPGWRRRWEELSPIYQQRAIG